MTRVLLSLPLFAVRWACDRALDALLGADDLVDYTPVADPPFFSNEQIDEIIEEALRGEV